MKLIAVLRENKFSAGILLLTALWLLFHRAIASWACAGAAVCWLYPDSWPVLLGVDSSSSAMAVALVAAVLFSLPFGRSGLLATLVGIELAEPVFGFWPTLLLYVVSSAVSIVLVHAVVEQSLNHPKAAWIHLRLKPVQFVFSASIRRHPVLWLAFGNVVSSQWYMSALGVVAKVRQDKVWAGLLLGNLAAFALVYGLSSVPGLDSVSVVLLTLVVAVLLSSPLLLTKFVARRAARKTRKKA